MTRKITDLDVWIVIDEFEHFKAAFSSVEKAEAFIRLHRQSAWGAVYITMSYRLDKGWTIDCESEVLNKNL